MVAYDQIWLPKIAVWARPSPPYYKINYDTAIRQDFSAQAVVCRDSRGTIIGCFILISPPALPVLQFLAKPQQLFSLVVWLYLWSFNISSWKVTLLLLRSL
jgi:hypothetical protein